jgi:hypothetical protein
MADMDEYRRLLAEYKGAVVTYYGVSTRFAIAEAEAAMVAARKELDALFARLMAENERLVLMLTEASLWFEEDAMRCALEQDEKGHRHYRDRARACRDAIHKAATPEPQAAPRAAMSETFVSATCGGEKCSICGAPAAAKVGEEIAFDDPMPHRHNLTAYICADHLDWIFTNRVAPPSSEFTDEEIAKWWPGVPPEEIIVRVAAALRAAAPQAAPPSSGVHKARFPGDEAMRFEAPPPAAAPGLDPDDPPDAPCEWDNSEAAAWQSGWSTGAAAALRAAAPHDPTENSHPESETHE